MSTIRPLGDRALVEPFQEEQVTSFGIVLPDSVGKEKKGHGKIVAIGTGEEITKLNLKIGDVVVFEKWGGEEVKVGKRAEEKEFKILNHDKILAVIE
jgi:chaperonin GroES